MAPAVGHSLSEVLRRTIVALCEVHVTYERHLEVFGSIHVRADDGRTVSFMLEEIIAKIQQERAREVNRDNPKPRSPENGSTISLNTADGATTYSKTPQGKTGASPSEKPGNQDCDVLSEEIALMRAQYSTSPEIKVKIEKIFEENNVLIVKDENRDSYAQFHITKVRKIESRPDDHNANTYDTISSLLEDDADLDKAIGQLLQGGEKNNKEGVKLERVSPPLVELGKGKDEDNKGANSGVGGKESEFEKSFPGQGQPVFPSQGDFLFNNTFHFTNGVISYDQAPNQGASGYKRAFSSQHQGQMGPCTTMAGQNVQCPPPMMGHSNAIGHPSPQFGGSFQGWYTLQGVNMGAPMAPIPTPINHFECPFCGVMLANKTNLKNHINSAHTRTKKFNCPTCGKVFYTSSAMNIHRRRNHLGLAKKYRCSICSKMFKIKSDLSAHMLDVHNRPRKLSPKTLHRLSQKVAQHLGENGDEQ